MTATAEYEKAKQTPPMLAKPGDTVRITIEGVTHSGFPVPKPGGWIEILPDDKVTVEVVAPARPDFRNGDVIQSTKHPHEVAVRAGSVWRWTSDPASSGWLDGITTEHLDNGYYTPIRLGGKSSAAQS